MTIPTVQITPTGIISPTYADILTALQADFRTIYGSDAYIEPDSQDGQWLAILAQGYYDTYQQIIAVYNTYSPTYAQGAGLSSVVKINGIRRQAPSHSVAVGDVSGQVGTTITNGVVQDENGQLWNLPPSVTIPEEAVISVTVTAQQPGAIIGPTGSINTINTPTLGWQGFINTSDAAPGDPVETDAKLRQRQTVSTSIPAITPLASTLGAIANLPGVERVAVYENYTGTTDADGLPPHSVSAVVQGGDLQDIIDAIGEKKTPGCATYGTTSGTFIDPYSGIPYALNYFVLANASIDVVITGSAQAGYSSQVIPLIKSAIASYLNSLDIGVDVQWSRLWPQVYLNGSAAGQTYEVTSLQICIHGGSPGESDVVVDFNKAAFCDVANISVTIS